MSLERIAVLGAGAFGTALAVVAAKAGRQVTLWSRDPAQAAATERAGENKCHLPGVPLPASIRFTADPVDLADADAVLFAVPAQALRTVAAAFNSVLPPGAPIVSCAKGIESGTGKLTTEVLASCIPGASMAALSGPGFAEEIARGLPTAVTIAAKDIGVAERLSAALSSETFRSYAADDLIGVELGGALKNVIAIACGIAVGRGLGESARAALLSRGLAEMTRLGAALGARPETFMGLSGLGDLVLTATSTQSRNTAFGMALGGGRSVADLTGPGAPLAEGVHTARVAAELGVRHRVDTPITAAVAAIISGGIGLDAAIEGLVSRPLKAENR